MEEKPLDEFLIEKPAVKRTKKEVFRWWESKRLRYNLYCLGCGILSMLIIESRLHLTREEYGGIYLPVSVIVFIAGNLFYFIGFLIEVLTPRHPKFGPIFLLS